MTALFFNLQLNIVSLPAYASALRYGRTAAAAARGRAGGRRGAPARRRSPLAFAAVSTAFSLSLAAADHEFKLARESVDPPEARRLYEGAIARWSLPRELGYRLAYVNALAATAGKTAGAERLEAVDRIADAGAAATACHPNDAVAHYILGSGALMQAILGRRERLADAEEQLDAALRLDPYRLDLLDWRRQAATLRGDKALESALRERIAHVESLHR